MSNEEDRISYSPAPDAKLISELGEPFVGNNGNASCRGYIKLLTSSFQIYNRETGETRDGTGELFSVDDNGDPVRLEKGNIVHADFFWNGDPDQNPGVNIRNRQGEHEGASEEVVIVQVRPGDYDEIQEFLQSETDIIPSSADEELGDVSGEALEQAVSD